MTQNEIIEKLKEKIAIADKYSRDARVGTLAMYKWEGMYVAYSDVLKMLMETEEGK